MLKHQNDWSTTVDFRLFMFGDQKFEFFDRAGHANTLDRVCVVDRARWWWSRAFHSACFPVHWFRPHGHYFYGWLIFRMPGPRATGTFCLRAIINVFCITFFLRKKSIEIYIFFYSRKKTNKTLWLRDKWIREPSEKVRNFRVRTNPMTLRRFAGSKGCVIGRPCHSQAWNLRGAFRILRTLPCRQTTNISLPIPFAPRPNYAPSSYAVVTKSVDENNEQMRRCLEQLSIGLEEQRSRSSLNLDLQQQNSQLRNQMQVMLEEKTNLERRLNNFKYELLQCQEELQRMKVENDRLTKFDKIVHAAIGMKRQRTE